MAEDIPHPHWGPACSSCAHLQSTVAPSPPPSLLQALSWLFSPILAALAALILFVLIRTFVLRAQNAFQRSIFLLPLFTFLTFFVVTWFIMAK